MSCVCWSIPFKQRRVSFTQHSENGHNNSLFQSYYLQQMVNGKDETDDNDRPTRMGINIGPQ